MTPLTQRHGPGTVSVVPRQQRTGWWTISGWPEDEPTRSRVWVELPLRNEFWFVAALFVLHEERFVIAELRIFPGEGIQRVRHRRDGSVLDRTPGIGEWSGDLGALDA